MKELVFYFVSPQSTESKWKCATVACHRADGWTSKRMWLVLGASLGCLTCLCVYWHHLFGAIVVRLSFPVATELKKLQVLLYRFDHFLFRAFNRSIEVCIVIDSTALRCGSLHTFELELNYVHHWSVLLLHLGIVLIGRCQFVGCFSMSPHWFQSLSCIYLIWASVWPVRDTLMWPHRELILIDIFAIGFSLS